MQKLYQVPVIILLMLSASMTRAAQELQEALDPKAVLLAFQDSCEQESARIFFDRGMVCTKVSVEKRDGSREEVTLYNPADRSNDIYVPLYVGQDTTYKHVKLYPGKWRVMPDGMWRLGLSKDEKKFIFVRA